MTSSETRPTTKLGYPEYLCFPDDGRRHEIIDGEHFVNPAPGTYHQRLSGNLFYQLHVQITLKERGQVFYAPTDLQLSEHDIVQPDLIVILKERNAIITPSRVIGSPNLLVEIISPSTGSHDRRRKKDLYCRAQIPEYWIIDPDQRSVEQYVLREQGYELVGPHKDRIDLTILPGACVDLSQVW